MRSFWPVLTLALSALVVGCTPIHIPTSETPAPGAPTSAPFLIPNPFDSSAATATPPPTPLPRPHVLRINLGARPDVLDPQRVSTNSEVAIMQMAYEGLTRLDEKGNVRPGASDMWVFSNEGRTLTFYLRDGLRRADGTRLTAGDFEFAIKHALDPRVAAMDPSFLDDVHGATAAYTMDARSRPEDIQQALDNVGIKAVNETLLVINFDQPTGYWPAVASTWLSFPIDRRSLESDPDAWWLRPESHNGNGPFVISDLQDQVIKFVPNPNYWGGRSPLERVEFYWISDFSAALDAYRAGKIDITRVGAESLVAVQADPTLAKELVRAPAGWVTYLGFNVKKAPFTDKNVRRAFSQALDRDTLVREILKGMGKAYLSWIPPGVPGWDQTATVPGYDPASAVRTLIEAGYGTADKGRVDCSKLGSVVLSFSSTPRNQSLFQIVADNLTRVFGCRIALEPIDPATYPLVVKDPRTAPQVYVMTWQQEYSHPQNWLFLQTCSGVYAVRLGYCNKDFDAALAVANREMDYDRSMALYRTAQKIWVGDMTAAFLWNNENAFVMKPHVRAWWEHYSTGDHSWPGQSGPVVTYDIDESRVGVGYPVR